MTPDQIKIIAIVCISLFLFIFSKLRYDLVGILTLGALIAFGLVDQKDVFSGFGHPATLTVAIVLIVSYGLGKSGIAESIGSLAAKAPSASLHIIVFIFITAFLSAFMNNVGALALMMPIAIQSSVNAGRSPSKILMPLSFGSMLGGLVTMIGTPPNIIIANYRAKTIGEEFSMFDFAPVGFCVAIIGIIYLSFVGWRLIKIRKDASDDSLFNVENYLFRIKVPKDFSSSKKEIDLNQELKQKNIKFSFLVRENEQYKTLPEDYSLKKNDLLFLEGSHEEIDKLDCDLKLELAEVNNSANIISNSGDDAIMEMVVAKDSKITNKSISEIQFNSKFKVKLLAVSRNDESIANKIKRIWLKIKIKDFRFQAGDIILIDGKEEDVEKTISELGCYPLADRKINFGKKKMAFPCAAIFIGAILLSSFELLSIQASLGLAALLMVMLKIIPVREMYEGVKLQVIVLLGTMIPLGIVLEDTGTTKLLADYLITLSGDVSLIVILTLVLLISMFLSDVLNNTATAILMAPIAKDIAVGLNVSPDPFLMAVAIGASCAFLTPIGHQNNILVMEPGGYKFKDYWKMGLPLEIIIVATAMPLILIFWPF